MSAWNHRRFARLPLPALALLAAFLLVFASACGGEDDPTSTPAPAAQPAATSTPAPAPPTATTAPAATATMMMPAAPTATVTTASAAAATATVDSSYDDYSKPTEAATATAMDEPTEEPMGAPTEEPMAAPEEVAIAIQGFQYQPAELTVPVGTTITWTNMDSAPHTATADDGSFNTGVLNQNESASVTFDTPGTYTYFCAVHPSMVATVIVTG